MLQNHSPWIEELDKNRKAKVLDKDLSTDILIIGGGIAGIVSAYFILKHTNFNIVLIEGDRVAHGATGYNAGEVINKFTKPLSDIVLENTFHQTIDAVKEVENAWNLLETILVEASIKIPFEVYKAYEGYTSLNDILRYLHDAQIMKQGGLKFEKLFIANTPEVIKNIPNDYKSIYEVVDHQDILKRLNTKNPKYIGVNSLKCATLNSALFTERILDFINKEYKNRFELYEKTSISKIHLSEKLAISETKHFKVTAKRVLLCTNSLGNIKIHNNESQINSKYEKDEAVIDYCAGYFEKKNLGSESLGFSEEQKPMYFLTRRKWNNGKDLLCVDGMEKFITVKDKDEQQDFPKEKLIEAEGVLRRNYKLFGSKQAKFDYQWSGLIGFTKSGVRIIGEEKENKNLLYNFGCNGVGILQSIAGGYRISKILAGEKLPRSIFDPR